jgi:hypothetical protein
VLVSADQFGLQGDVVGQQRVSDDPLAPAKVFARKARLGRGSCRFEFLSVHGAVAAR